MDLWCLRKEGFDPKAAATDGNRFLCANGYMGLRGVPEEAGSALFPAITLAGVFDRYKDRWREPVNAPNALYIRPCFNGQPLSVVYGQARAHVTELDLRRGIYSRHTDFGPLRVCSRRFVSMASPHLMADEYILTVLQDGELTLEAGISCDIWDINGPHLYDFVHHTDDVLLTTCVTGEKRIAVAAAQAFRAEPDAEDGRRQGADGVFHSFRRAVHAGETLKLQLFSAIYTSQDLPGPAKAARGLCLQAETDGFDACLRAHAAAWEDIWARSAVILEGDDAAALAMHASQYHLNSIAPRHADDLSIPARGLSGQTYKGAVFWDSEIFFFPMFVHTQPEVAKALLRYRINSLPGALQKAAQYGYRGAFYAWESQEGGQEGCTDFNVVDVFTHRPVRTYFRDKQIHISADIVYALQSYYDITGDRSLLEEGGARVILECARFYLSRADAHADSAVIDFADVIGPDEYHERVTNNAFTNMMILHCLESALSLKTVFADRPGHFQALLRELDYERDWPLLADVCARIRRPRQKNGVIEQFDGYFQLEDCTLETVRSRLRDPREYWGGDHGVAGTTQIIKQADVIALMALLPDQFTAGETAASWAYYEPRTEHGSSLSACMYALTACRLGRPEDAWPLFLKTAQIDVLGGGKEWAGEVYIGGTHPASNGGAWMIAALGFAGLRVRRGQPAIDPRLPKQISRLSFPVTLNGVSFRIEVTHEGGRIIRL